MSIPGNYISSAADQYGLGYYPEYFNVTQGPAGCSGNLASLAPDIELVSGESYISYIHRHPTAELIMGLAEGALSATQRDE